ncbi:tetratricopeptide repeat protein [Streptomyces daliensis]
MRTRGPRGALIVVVTALLLTAAAWFTSFPVPGVPGGPGGQDTPAADGPALRGPAAPPAFAPLTSAGLERRLTGLRRHLRAQPRDAAAWAALGTGYVEQARRTAEPGYCTRAQRALARSLSLRSADGNDAALAGQAALAAARHDFRSALRLAREALTVNPYGELALAVRVDALVELGRYGAAHDAALQADARRPGIPVFTRLAYVRELRGERAGARRVLERALDSAASPGDLAQVATALAELDRAEGRADAALRHYATALRADPGHLPALLGRGQVRAAEGKPAAAVRDVRAVAARQPLPAHLALLGELYEARGRKDRAKEQYALLGAWTKAARAHRVDTDLDTALVAADHGDGAVALRAARAAWDRRHTVHTADALAWALHRQGHDARALRLARLATDGLTDGGYRNAMFHYHRSEIAHALGDGAQARTHRRTALRLRTALTPKAREVLTERAEAAR